MAEITSLQISAAFDLGMEWLSGKISRSEAIDRLSAENAVNRVSAGDLLQVLKAMLAGERFTRSISAPAADIYLERIWAKGGQADMAAAISATDKHIEYYEGLRSVTLHKLRAVRDEWNAKSLDAELPMDTLSAQFELRVASLLAAPAAERRKFMPKPGTKPDFGYAKVKVYQRSAAVVAEVLLRADGKCESCKNPAPFKRASDGRPYLEVHHKVRLADDGEDTAENAIAVCPNCHRFHHYG